MYPSCDFVDFFSETQDRMMLTGRHIVRDVTCKKCEAKLGWMYEFATEDGQRYEIVSFAKFVEVVATVQSRVFTCVILIKKSTPCQKAIVHK